ncbi:M48 family metalloprotease [Chitinophaga sp. SYP-B3965]|uniref:M48 family metalloprotease n=1 Tax=Chitinophaga sp. SYP-B3965 TaxID=2663120 RepID=UPI0012995F5C|nr:M48 family metallopeptidase [Chitinophaga sp. SYP-B3965]MRG47219.1 M48 family metalloprotease [Chitinophaga sp. SYP-B3965]
MPAISLYPPNPLNVSPELTAPAASFKKQVFKVIGAIFLFCLVYLLLLALAVGLAAACIFAGIFLITSLPKFITILIGLGIIGLGVMVIIFLVKFVFAKQNAEKPERLQVFENEHPALFAFIRQLTKDTNTPMPKKIFLVPDVNAAVFYNSSFWSMFLPVKKNLEIGLGLVNVLNLSEFKMVLAHEFGHFSQSSMKLGSYVFTMNKAIYNMLYQNDGYDKALQGWADIHGIFAIMAAITVWIARGIQKVLRDMYGVINLQYMSLSREMEFHADAVAVSVTGSNIATSAMRRIEYVGHGMTYCINKTGELAEKNAALQNMFEMQREVNLYFANVHTIEVENGLPAISNEYLASFTNSRLKYKDQWATHPSMDEREERFQAARVDNTPDHRSPWILFSDPAALEEKMTQHYFAINYPNVEVKERMDSVTMIQKLKEHNGLYQFPTDFNEFYDNRTFQKIEEGRTVQIPATFAELYAPEVVNRVKRYFRNQIDLAYLKAIERKELDVKYFQFDQSHYNRKEAEKVITDLEKEVNEGGEWLMDIDYAAYLFHLQKDADLSKVYAEIVALQEEKTAFEAISEKITNRISYIYRVQQFTIEGLRSELGALKDEEQPFKDHLDKLLRSGIVVPAIDDTFQTDASAFLEKSISYIVDDQARGTEIVALFNLCHRTMECFDRGIILKKKAYLERILN